MAVLEGSKNGVRLVYITLLIRRNGANGPGDNPLGPPLVWLAVEFSVRLRAP